jgi:hypothetical protein
MNLTEWVELLKSKLQLGDRRISFSSGMLSGLPSRAVYINYYNLPAFCKDGAELENNRIMLEVEQVQERFKVSLRVLAVKCDKLRGKTTSAEGAADYIANYLNTVALNVPPNFTHTKF